MKNNYHLLLYLLFSLFIAPVYAQVGMPPMVGFAPSEYNGAPDIRTVMQSKRGFLYVASTGGNILEYDGVSWKKIAVNCIYVNKLVEADNGNIFFSDMFSPCAGYLRPNAMTGKWESIPIHFDLPDSVTQKSDFIVRVYKAKGEIYYVLFGATLKDIPIVYKQKNGKFVPLPIKSSSPVHISITEEEIWKVQKDGKIELYDFEGVKKEDLQMEAAHSNIYQIDNYLEGEVLFMTVFDNIWRYNCQTQETLSFLSEEALQKIKPAQLIDFNILKNKNVVIGTVKKGIFIVDENGNIIRNISTAEGLRDDIILKTTIDYQNQLWAVLYNGINRIDINAPLSIWTKENGVLGSTTQGVIKFQDTYFAATITNIIYFDTDENVWKPIKGANIENFIAGVITLSDKKEHLFIGDINNLQEVMRDNNGGWKIEAIVKSDEQIRVRGVTNHPSNPDKIFFWGLGGIRYINYDEEVREVKEIEALKEIPLIAGAFQKIEDNIWATTVKNRQPIKIEMLTEDITILPYDTASVVYSDGEMFLFKNNYDSVFNLDKDYKKVHNANISKFFEPYRDQSIDVHRDSSESIWIYKANEFFIHVLQKTSNGYQRNNVLEQSLAKYMLRHIYQDPNDRNIFWISTSVGILRVDVSKATVEKVNNLNFKTYIRQIKIGQDSIIFGGNFFTTNKLDNDSLQYTILSNQLENKVRRVDFIHNSISFQVAAPFFIEEKQIQFAYFLEGLDEKWSEWTSLNIKEYNNLKEGNYTLRSKAKNYLGQESKETTYKFKVLPPWHRTTTAYVLYLIFGVGVIFGSNRLYTHRLRKQNENLENLVLERTDELSQKNAELSTQNEEIVQQRDQLNIKNYQIEEQNKNIVSSINYAKRIQTALLPIEKRIKQEIPEHFIFYKPRDIVSGDFYWIEKVENKVIIAIADCTGHGVPGAFMSMLGSSGLTDAVFQQKLISPDLILTHLHNYIYSALKQNQSDNRDGMDICIIVWDKTKKQIQYAGAMNPLYYVQNEEFVQIKADKIPVGGRIAKERVYTPHVINLHVPTTIYLASDGYQDQFGGKDNRKFMTKKFRELLLEISHLPIKEQEARISQVFDRWKGKNHQIDDVLVMGMKIE